MSWESLKGGGVIFGETNTSSPDRFVRLFGVFGGPSDAGTSALRASADFLDRQVSGAFFVFLERDGPSQKFFGGEGGCLFATKSVDDVDTVFEGWREGRVTCSYLWMDSGLLI